MKTNKLMAILLASAALAAGCQKSQEYTDVVFFTGTESSPVTNIYLDGLSSVSVSITSSAKMTEDVTVFFEIVPAALEAYNAEHGTSYQLLPEGSYELSTTETIIRAGSAVSEPINVALTSMDDFEVGSSYCLPLRITGTSTGIQVLASSEMTYLVFNQFIKTRGVDLGGNWYIIMSETMQGKPELSNLSACTLEIRMYANKWSTLSHGISSLIGVEENFILRIGDTSIGGVDNPKSILNVGGRGSTLAALNNPLSLNRWYHVAVVEDGSNLKLYIDGTEVASVSSANRDPVDLSYAYLGSAFSIGRSASDYRYFNGYVSEARAWSRALTPMELRNNQCKIDPTTANGLIGYWRLDEAEGQTFKDLSGNGYDGVACKQDGRTTDPVWTDEIKCPAVD